MRVVAGVKVRGKIQIPSFRMYWNLFYRHTKYRGLVKRKFKKMLEVMVCSMNFKSLKADVGETCEKGHYIKLE